MGKKPSIQQMVRAKEQLDDVLFGCVLNIKLYQSGICPKLIVDMDETDINEYIKMLEGILFSK